MQRAAVLFTGGKDSTYVIELLRKMGYEVSCLITVSSKNKASYMLHTANIEIARLSAEALEIPIVYGSTAGKKEEELDDIRDTVLRARQTVAFEVLASGGLASNYQLLRIAKIGSECGLSVESPLWGINQKRYLEDIVEKGYHFVITSVAAEGLDRSWLGREITKKAILELEKLSAKYRFNIAFEGGEAETLVLDCPLFRRKKLELVDCGIEWYGSYGVLVIKEARLVEKD